MEMTSGIDSLPAGSGDFTINPVKWEAITVAGDCLKILMLLHTSSKAAESHTSLMSLLLEAIVMVLLASENDSSQEVRELKTASVRLVSQLAHSQTSVGYFKDALLWMPSTRRQKLQVYCDVVKDEKEYAPSNTRVGFVEEDSTDVAFYIDEESFDALDYENAYLAFDPEKSPKFHY
ncbi:HEAT repeat-containing protein [Artemisia annua]|uniref:HEAT repeat-containing protein n=1 Tax=Artemisia annua TaxID=35608 RepID=A0A2U1MZK1_ARTAN|nr:HEAT repeat-containing protein [Artemisia annua]